MGGRANGAWNRGPPAVGRECEGPRVGAIAQANDLYTPATTRRSMLMPVTVHVRVRVVDGGFWIV